MRDVVIVRVGEGFREDTSSLKSLEMQVLNALGRLLRHFMRRWDDGVVCSCVCYFAHIDQNPMSRNV
jgi:hypothetical protein